MVYGYGRMSLLILSNVLITLSLIVFATGFFPYKPFIGGHAAFPDDSGDAKVAVFAPFDKVIFMVVDALRSDFVYGDPSGFKFTQKLIRDGSAIPYTAHASSPTITMPRVKAITTGSVPSFLDVILNFAESDTSSNLASQDTWLWQLKNKTGGNLVMYGDDTWLKLFPDMFLRADGTTSFFVSDFTEVDNNVTRHIPFELGQHDWNGMIMHYLGMDHIGHKMGPRSPFMIPKQTEMDDIVQQIYTAIESEEHMQNTVLVLCGDHGMNDAGNHGGSGEGETSPALCFISPKLKGISQGFPSPLAPASGQFGFYKTIEQSDIAPTLAALLGFPVPLNNLGIMIPEFLDFWPKESRHHLLKNNAVQVMELVKETFTDQKFDASDGSLKCHDEDDSHQCNWKHASNLVASIEEGSRAAAIESFYKFLQEAQESMSSAASNYNVSRLYMGIVIASAAFLTVLPLLKPILGLNANSFWVFLITLLYGVMMFASSYVEEEQQFWYWVTSGWFFWLSTKSFRWPHPPTILNRILSAFYLLASLRLLRAWNQTGQKYAGNADIARTFLPLYPPILWCLVGLTFLVIGIKLYDALPSQGVPAPICAGVTIGLCLAGLSFKVAFTRADAPELLGTTWTGNSVLQFLMWLTRPMQGNELVVQARAVFLGVGVMGFMTLVNGVRLRRNNEDDRKMSGILLQGIRSLLTLFLVTQTRLTNIPLFLLFELFLFLAEFNPVPHRLISTTTMEISITSIVMQYMSFFAMGGSNAISSVDLSQAYNGVGGYNVGVVGILTFVGNWAGPIYWWFACLCCLLVLDHDDGSNNTEIFAGYHRHQQQQSKPADSDEHQQRSKQELTKKTLRQTQKWDTWLQHFTLLTSFTSISVLSTEIACCVLRQHLFIWTVFSPKFLFIVAWSVGMHVVVNGVLGVGIVAFF